MTGHTTRLEEVRAAAARISATLLELREFAKQLGWEREEWTGASAQAVQEVRDRLRRYGCLYLALDNLLEQAAELAENGGEPAAVLDGTCEVVFTAGTGEPVETVHLTVAALVAAAGRDETLVRRAVDTQQAAETRTRLVGLADDLRTAVAKVRHLAEAAVTEGLGGSVDPAEWAVPPELADRLVSATADGPAGAWWRAVGSLEKGKAMVSEVQDLVERFDTARRRLRADCRSELRGRLEGYRQMAVERGEDDARDARYLAARQSLGIATFDVPVAAEAVRAYQRAVKGQPA